jgi:hypothetical protein
MALKPDTGGNPLDSSGLPIPIPRPLPVTDVTVPTPADTAVTPRVGASIIVENPVDTVPKTTTTAVPTTSTPAVLAATIVDAVSSKPIVIANPNVVSDGVQGLAGSFGGGGGGGGGASSEEGSVMEEPKKPNYLVLGLMGLGAYFLLKKLL